MTAAEIEHEYPEDRDLFRMGAVVAIGELYDEGLLGDKDDSAEIVRGYLASFGVQSMGDIARLRIGGSYREDFRRLFAQAS